MIELREPIISQTEVEFGEPIISRTEERDMYDYIRVPFHVNLKRMEKAEFMLKHMPGIIKEAEVWFRKCERFSGVLVLPGRYGKGNIPGSDGEIIFRLEVLNDTE